MRNLDRSIIVSAQEHKGSDEVSANITSDYVLQINYDETGRLYDATVDLLAAGDNDLISQPAELRLRPLFPATQSLCIVDGIPW